MYHISIDNEIETELKIDFVHMFEMGYSTKGEGRGLGLPRAKQICNRYGLEIKILIEHNNEKRIKCSEFTGCLCMYSGIGIELEIVRYTKLVVQYINYV